jgi:hypothetical protein
MHLLVVTPILNVSKSCPLKSPWGVREFHLVHPDGHTFRVSCGEDCK